MKRLLPLVLVVAACSSGGLTAEAEIAAATFVAEFTPSQVDVVDRDRLGSVGGEEDRLDVLQLSTEAHLISLYPSTPVPEPFQFVRDPLSSGAVAPMLEADRLVAVVYPLIDPTPGGRVLRGSLIALDDSGMVVGTDWDEASDAAVTELIAWGAETGRTPAETIELAVRGLAGSSDPDAETAATFLR